ncbi:MAG: amidohydrolase [Pyrinomonadaceae bacterium]
MKFFSAVLILLSALDSFALPAGADLIVINANVRTMASSPSRAEAIAVSDGKITAIGTSKAIRELADENTRVIDAGGKLVLPGFNDAHVHFGAIGNTFSSVKLDDVRSPAEFAARIASVAQFIPKGRWILGSGWDNTRWVPNDLPTKALVDELTPDNPVFVYNMDGKAVFVNSATLKLAAIDKSVKEPPGGLVHRDPSGEPSGVFRGNAVALISKFVPINHTRNWVEIILSASKYAASLGVTSVQDTHSDDLSVPLRELSLSGKLKTRVYDCITLSDWQKLAAKGVKAASGDAMVRAGCVKFFAEDDTKEIAELDQDIAGADKARLQVAIHAIGPRPNEIVLSSFEKAIKANGPRDRRFRVEHAHNVNAQDWPRFLRSNIIASMQPWLFYGENGAGLDDFRKIFEQNTVVAFGSDASITDFNPMMGIYAAVSGKNAISVEQAVRAYTVGSAFAEFQEKVKGTIEVGKLADVVILSEDIFSIDRAKIRNVRVDTTIVSGSVVFQRN